MSGHLAFCSPCGRHVPWRDDAHVCHDDGSPRCAVCGGRDGDHWSAPHLSRAVIVSNVEDAVAVLREGGAFILRPDEPKPPKVAG